MKKVLTYILAALISLSFFAPAISVAGGIQNKGSSYKKNNVKQKCGKVKKGKRFCSYR